MTTPEERPFDTCQNKDSPNTNEIPVISSSHPDYGKSNYFYITEKFTYNFDFPDQHQPGYMEIDNNKIVVMFPEQFHSTHVPKYPHIQSIQFYLNRQLVFSYDWLPIYSLNDFYRVKDMLAISFEKFRTKRNVFNSWPKKHHVLTQNNLKKFTRYVKPTSLHKLNCLEEPNTTSLTLDVRHT
jgi:hypothetical protein